MAQTGFDFFTGPPNCGEERVCRVCGSQCTATRNFLGPTSFTTAIARKPSLHDRFLCPHSSEPWHERALELMSAITSSPSQRLAAVMQEELEELLQQRV